MRDHLAQRRATFEETGGKFVERIGLLRAFVLTAHDETELPAAEIHPQGRPSPQGAYAPSVVGKLIALVLPLGLDTFAVAAALAMVGATRSTRLKVTVVFPAFEAGMPLIGLALGAPLGRTLGNAAVYVAIGVLLAFGLYTLFGPERAEEQRLSRLTSASGIGWIVLGITVSLDELAIGFTLGLLRLPVVLVIVLIALQAVIVTQLGLRFGDRLSERLREASERLAGLMLAGLAVALLVEKLVA